VKSISSTLNSGRAPSREGELLLCCATSLATPARTARMHAIVDEGVDWHLVAHMAQVQAVVPLVATNYAPFLSASNVTVCFSADPNLPLQYDAVVTITYNYTQKIPFMSAVPLTLTSSSQMLVSD
jgi:hypothetical protein